MSTNEMNWELLAKNLRLRANVVVSLDKTAANVLRSLSFVITETLKEADANELAAIRRALSARLARHTARREEKCDTCRGLNPDDCFSCTPEWNE